jgi:ectoine hydroxylase-related dioxygenase (phytanoyl-CoA dioxygenase family)
MVCRSVTAEEFDHYWEYGWVKLKGFVDADVVRSMLAVAKERMGEDGDSNQGGGDKVEEGENRRAAQSGISYFNPEYSHGLAHPVIRPVIEAAGKGAKFLMGRGSDVHARYYSDVFVPKLPSSKATKHGGNGPTAFHQDFITFSVDRSGGMTMWFPLEAYGPEYGTMSFLNGSHRRGVMGDYTTYKGGDAIDTYPELGDLTMSQPMTYELGDISVHSHLTIHGAGVNVTDRPRWAYILIVQPSDACWTGAPSTTFASLSMKPWEPLPDDRFPIMS